MPDYCADRSVAATARIRHAAGERTLLLDLALNMKTPVIYDPDPADSEKRVVNPKRRSPPSEKQKLIKETVPNLDVLRSRAHGAIGATLQRHVQQSTSASLRRFAPRLSGMTELITLRPHQKDAVWRCMTGETRCAHLCRVGENRIWRVLAMKLKQVRAGAEDVIIVVPNHISNNSPANSSSSTLTRSCWRRPRTTSRRIAESCSPPKSQQRNRDAIIVTHQQLRAHRHVAKSSRRNSSGKRSTSTTN